MLIINLHQTIKSEMHYTITEVAKLRPAGHFQPIGLLNLACQRWRQIGQIMSSFWLHSVCPVSPAIPLWGSLILFWKHHNHWSWSLPLWCHVSAAPASILPWQNVYLIEVCPSVQAKIARSRNNPGSFVCISSERQWNKIFCPSQQCLEVSLCVKWAMCCILLWKDNQATPAVKQYGSFHSTSETKMNKMHVYF